MRDRRPSLHVRTGVVRCLSLVAVILAGAAIWAQQRTRLTQDEPPPPPPRASRQTPTVIPQPATGPATAPIAYRPMSFARAAAFVDAATRGLKYVPGEVLVKFKSGMTIQDQARALQAVRSQPTVDSLRWVDQVAILTDETQPDANVLAAQLRAQPEVEFAEPNYIRRRGSVMPNDPGFSPRQWNLPAIQMPDAWSISPGGDANVIVAVIDTGVTSVASQNFTVQTWSGTAIISVSLAFRSNPDLSVSRLVSPHDFATGMGNVVLDSEGHGTHVSGTIGQDTNNGIADAGIAYNTRIMPVKVCASFWDVQFAWSAAGQKGLVPSSSGGCADSDIAAGIRYAADNGAKAANISLGGSGTSTTIQSALTYAVGKGVFIAMAGGNEYEDGNPTEYPAAYGPGINGAMSVAAVGKTLVRSHYSNTGSYIEIAAPGGDDRVGGGSDFGYVWQSTLYPPDNDLFYMTGLIPRFDRFAEVGYEGTSMATPHVVGVAALMISRGITKPSDIEAILKATAKDLGATGRDDSFGSGLIQARTALFGQGIVK